MSWLVVGVKRLVLAHFREKVMSENRVTLLRQRCVHYQVEQSIYVKAVGRLDDEREKNVTRCVSRQHQQIIRYIFGPINHF